VPTHNQDRAAESLGGLQSGANGGENKKTEKEKCYDENGVVQTVSM
jgi:hypothetical protein